MALNRAPGATQVNGAAMLVKGDDEGLFASFQRVPGFASFTLPDETGSTNETQLMDGSIAFAQIAGVGTISGSIGSITSHPTHQWLAARRRDGRQITVTIVRPATEIIKQEVANVANAATGTIITFTGEEVAAIKEGQLIAVGATGDAGSAADDVGGAYVAYGATPTAADDHKFRSVISVDPDAKSVKVAPAITTALTAAASNIYSLRNAGILYANILCSVNGFGDGDFQAGSAIAANISLQPDSALTRGVEWRILPDSGALELAATGIFDGVFAGLTAVT